MSIDRPTTNDDRLDAPGGERAVAYGCMCPIVDNGYGWGYIVHGVFVIHDSCLLHGKFFK